MRTVIFQSIVFLLGRVRNIAGSQGNAYGKQGSRFYKACWQLYQPTQLCLGSSCPTVKGSDEAAGDPAVRGGHWGQRLQRPSVSKQERFDAVVTGRPGSVIPHGLRDRCTLYSETPFVLLQWFLQLKSSSGLGEALRCHRG